MTIGHKIIGRGLEHVLVMHDWFSDCTSYEKVLPFLDTQNYTYAFMDLRGYGKSKAINGECSVEEASRDAIELANYLKWDGFHVIGHSMSGMIAQRIALDAESRIKSVIAITPVPACGSPAPEDVLAFLEDAASLNDESAAQIIQFLTGNRHSEIFVREKVQRWRSCSILAARVAYLYMFSQTDFSNQAKNLKTPFLIILGEYDADSYNENAMRQTLCQWYPNTKLITLPNCGHYPMEETPNTLVQMIQDYLESIDKK